MNAVLNDKAWLEKMMYIIRINQWDNIFGTSTQPSDIGHCPHGKALLNIKSNINTGRSRLLHLPDGLIHCVFVSLV